MKYVYIYNLRQANFYMINGCICLETGKHVDTKKVWYKFDKADTNEAYEKWCKECEHYKVQQNYTL